MALTIGDITELNHNAEFRSDVQISNFRTEANLDLVRTYMFTAGSFPQRKSSADVLRLLREAAVGDLENRFLIQATYGRGKSHFGLAVANYFGKAADSPEVELLLKNLEYAYDAPAEVEAFRNFKRHRAPYLVLLLRGDASVNLRDQFFRELEAALSHNEVTKGVETPFWFNEVLRYFGGLKPEQVKQADSFLAKHKMDLPLLRQKVEQRETGMYQVCVELIRNLTGIKPDFNGETSIADAIEWVVKELCLARKLIGGVLVLFDEFSEFVRSYADLHPTGVPLMELLNGVEANRGHVVFAALSQHEPEKVVKSDGTAQYASMTKELTRLPQANRHWLHSTLEDVLGAYFRPSPDNWTRFMRMPGVSSQVAGASDLAYDVLSERYRRTLNWDAQKFQEKVTRECFPLHPLTTGLLSSVDFEAASTTRSVLGFLTDEEAPLKQNLDQPAVHNERPNWVLPIALVDYFQEMLSEQVWEQYTQVNLPDLEPEQRDVLKAMVLQKAANLPTKSVGFPAVIGELAGLSPKRADEVLKQLYQQRYIRYDDSNRIYSFWSGSNAAIELERLLNRELEDLERHKKLRVYLDDFDTKASNKVNDLISAGKLLAHQSSYPVSVEWGHPEDWAAQLVVLTRESWNIRTLELLTSRYSATVDEVPGCRGLVLLPLARSDEDLAWFDEHLEKTLDTSAKLKSAPVVVVKPTMPTKPLVTDLQKFALLSDGVFISRIVNQIGTKVIEEEQGRIASQIQQATAQLLKGGDLLVPAEARGPVRALSVGVRASDRIERTLREVYRVAYHARPGEFFAQYKCTANNLRSAVQDLIPVLATNDVHSASKGLSKVAGETVKQFLASSAWGVLSPDAKLQEPRATFPRKAWDRLNGSIPPGQDLIPLREVLLELLNVPYGYDHNTLALLFSAWLGYNRSHLSLVMGSRMASINDYVGLQKKIKPAEFIKLWSGASLRRKDSKKLLVEVQEAVEKVEAGGLSFEEALALQGKLAAYANDSDLTDPTLLGNAKLALQKLKAALEQLEAYDKEVGEVQTDLARSRTVQDVLLLIGRVSKLNKPVTVVSKLPTPHELRESLIEAVGEKTNDFCEVNERLTDIKQYGKQEDALKRLRAELQRRNLSDQAARVARAQETLEQERERLESALQTDGLLAQIKSVDPAVGLSKLRKDVKELDSLVSHPSEQVRSAAMAKRALVVAELERLEQLMLTLEGRLDNVDSEQAASALERELIGQKGRFEGTNDAREIEQAVERLDQLKGFFKQLSGPLPKSRGEARVALERLTRLTQDYEGALGEGHAQRVGIRIAELEAFVQGKESEALAWLEESRGLLDRGADLGRLQSRLLQPHPFLPEAAQADLDALRVQLEEKLAVQAQEKQLLKRIEGMSTTGPLADLLRRKDELEELNGTQSIAEAAARKRSQLEEAIRGLEAQARGWLGGLAGLTTARDLEAHREQINRALAKYEGTVWYERLEELSDRCRSAGELMKEAEARPNLPNPQAAAERVARLGEIERDSGLNDAQRQAVRDAIEAVRRHVAERESKAGDWLRERERELAAGRLAQLQQSLSRVPAFLTDADAAALDELRVRLDAALERQEQNRAVLASLRALTPAGTLRELRNQEAQVKGWLAELTEPEAREAAARKLSAVEHSIQDLLRRLDGCRIRLEQATDFTKVRTLVTELRSLEVCLAGAPEAAEVSALLERADELESYIESLKTFKPSSIDSPARADALIAGVAELNRRYHHLSPEQLALGRQTEALLRQALEGKRREAAEWLEQRKKRVEAGDLLDSLEAELHSPPPFLSDQGQAEVERLRVELRRRLDEDTRNRIEQLFGRLNAAERKACLARLNQLLQEEMV